MSDMYPWSNEQIEALIKECPLDGRARDALMRLVGHLLRKPHDGQDDGLAPVDGDKR